MFSILKCVYSHGRKKQKQIAATFIIGIYTEFGLTPNPFES